MYQGLRSKDNYQPARHMGKILDCGGICARPKARSVPAVLREDSFDLVLLHESESVTPVSAAAHSLYEKTQPDILEGPGGRLLLGEATYTPPPGRSVRCANAVFEPTEYMIKLEGAQLLGYRTVFIGGIRDPILIEGIDDFLRNTAGYTKSLFPGSVQIIWHKYGQNAVMGAFEPVKTTPHELGIMGEVVTQTQAFAGAVANYVRMLCLHNSYPGQLATAGNFAIPLSPHEQPAGPAFRCSVYHLMPCADRPDWPIEVLRVGVDADNVASRDPNYAPECPPAPAFKAAASNGISAHASNGTTPNTLPHLAKVVRPKNSGPFEVTMNVMLDTEEVFERAEKSGLLTRELITKLYSVPDDKILTCMFFRPALAWKMTIVRPHEQGSIGQMDTFGTAQHAPLLDVEIP